MFASFTTRSNIKKLESGNDSLQNRRQCWGGLSLHGRGWFFEWIYNRFFSTLVAEEAGAWISSHRVFGLYEKNLGQHK